MHTIAFHIPKRTIFLLLLMAGIIQVACKKGSSGNPVITHVRAIDSTARDSFFVQAFPGTLIVIQGSNFEGLQHVYFNGMDAPFNAALNSGTNIIISVPSNAPTAPPLNSVSNTIMVVTNHGSASYTFTLILPPPAITTVSDENALAGSTLIITGTNFYGISKIVFPGGISAGTYTVDSATQITVTVPAGITAGDSLRIYGTFGATASPFIFDNWLSPTTGFLANFDGTTSQWSPPSNNPYFGWSQNQWVGTYVTDPTVFPGMTGNCAEINPANSKPAGDNSWWQDNNSIITNTATWTSNSSASIGNYALKFEANVTNWSAGSIWIAGSFANWAYMAQYAPWKTAAGGKYSSNGWVTVTIPLTAFLSCTNNVYTSAGTGASSITSLQNGGGGMFMFMYANDGAGTIPGGSFVMGIDNVRIVPIN
jgi:xyloglucan-binding protein